MFLPQRPMGSASGDGALNGFFLVLNLGSNTIEIGSNSGVQSFPPVSMETNLNSNILPTFPPGRNFSNPDMAVASSKVENASLIDKEDPNWIPEKKAKNVVGSCVGRKEKRGLSHLELQDQLQDYGRRANGKVNSQRTRIKGKPTCNLSHRASSTGYSAGSPPQYLVKLLNFFGWRVEFRYGFGDYVYISPHGATYWSLPKAFEVFLHSTYKFEGSMLCSSKFVDGRTQNQNSMNRTSNLVNIVVQQNICHKDEARSKRGSEKRNDALSDSCSPVAFSKTATALSCAAAYRWNHNLPLMPEEGVSHELPEDNVGSFVGDEKLGNEVKLLGSRICKASEISQNTNTITDSPSHGARRSTRLKQTSYPMDYDLALEMVINEEWKSSSQEDQHDVTSSTSDSEFVLDAMSDTSTDDEYLETTAKRMEKRCLAAAKDNSRSKHGVDPIPTTSKTRRSLKFDREHIVADAEVYKEAKNRLSVSPKSVVNTRAKNAKFDSLRVRVQNKDQSSLPAIVGDGEKVLVAENLSLPSCGKRKPSSCGKFNVKNKKKRTGACGLIIRSKRNFSECYSSQTKVNILSWLINSGIMTTNEKLVHRIANGRATSLEGFVTQGKIQCSCCNKTMSLLEFEAHAGSNLCQPWKNIYLTSGKSLMQCLMDAWQKDSSHQKVGFQTIGIGEFDPNDDTCGVCGDGGILICCDSCPSTFHQDCLMLKTLPEGRWYCPHCTCKFCMKAVQDSDIFDGTLTLYTCFLCGRKYHLDCAWENGMNKMVEVSVMFCGISCSKVDSALSDMLGVANRIQDGFSWTLLKHRDEDAGIACDQRLCSILECNTKLSMALSVLNECFIPLVDPRTGLDMLSQAVYNCGSNFKRLSYEGFYTAILEKDDEIVSVASLRIHGDQLAEMPFIGTRPLHQRKGMCRYLLEAIEDMLRSLDVERLVIPAVPDLLTTWMTSFSFKPLEASLKDEIRNLSLMVFAETTMLQKNISYNGIEYEQDEQTTADSPQGVPESKMICNSMLATRSSADFSLELRRTVNHGGVLSMI